MANQHFYEQATNAFNREWVDDNFDGSEMTDEEATTFQEEMATVDAEAAAYRKEERDDWHSSRFSEETDFAMDMAF